MDWLETFHAETAVVIHDPFLACLAEAIACVESARGKATLGGPGGLNEIGYKALPGHPSVEAATREANGAGRLRRGRAAFRLFADRGEQARALLWLMHGSAYYEAARLLYVLAFYAAYAPGREEGACSLIAVFNELAASGAHAGVRPFAMAHPAQTDPETLALNHAAARQAVRLFCRLTGAADHLPPKGDAA